MKINSADQMHFELFGGRVKNTNSRQNNVPGHN